MKLVKFKDGTYGIRRFNFFMLSFEYLDFSCDSFCYSFWWPRTSKHFEDCKAEYSVAVQAFNNLIDPGEIVK